MNHSFQKDDGFYSDLAAERKHLASECHGVEFKRIRERGFIWERIRIINEEGERKIGRPIGSYDTLIMKRSDLVFGEEIFDAAEEIARELCAIFEKKRINPERILAVGLGNEELTPDSLGAKCASLINATMHLPTEEAGDVSKIAVFSPGVSSKSGIDSVDAIIAICDRIKPDAVIAIDALTARSPSRLGNTIQFSDTGIYPGSGVGGARLALNQSTLGVPVISIGMPTVVSAKAFCKSDCDSELSSISSISSMLVAPKEIDIMVQRAAEIIALGINQAFGIV